MKKNLIVLHLESMPQSAFWQYMGDIPALWDLCNRSLCFRRFYAASTSSVMSMSDMVHGDSAELDHNSRFPKNKTSLAGRSSNLFRILLERGYRTKGMQYGSFCVGDAPNNFWGVWPDEGGQFGWFNDFETFQGEARDFMAGAKEEGKPFALYFWSMATHIANDLEGGAELGFCERFQHNYRLLDKSVRRLLDDVTELGLLEDTIILAYGDHGDDFWRHGFNRGRTHVIEPYATTVWTPMFIYNNDKDVGIFDGVTSSIDIKPTILRMLDIGREPEKSESPFAGVDIFTEGRGWAFSQSSFALQLEHSDPSGVIEKSYAITDGDIRLVASSGGGDIKQRGGMELFMEQWDYGNNRNLLDFFQLNDDGVIVAFDVPDAVHPHFTLSFTRERVMSLAQSYHSLRQALMKFIEFKESEALKLFVGSEKHLFPMEAFRLARLRQW